MNYYNEIKEKLIKSEIYDKTRDYSKDRNKVNVYFETGRLLSAAGKEYGKNIIKKYSEKLMIDVGKKYNERSLRYMRQFYEMIIKIKWNTVCSKLSWSHYREVLSLKDINKIRYYLNKYDRLNDDVKNKLIKSEQLKVEDLVPNPIIIKTKVLNKKLNEYALGANDIK